MAKSIFRDTSKSMDLVWGICGSLPSSVPKDRKTHNNKSWMQMFNPIGSAQAAESDDPIQQNKMLQEQMIEGGPLLRGGGPGPRAKIVESSINRISEEKTTLYRGSKNVESGKKFGWWWSENPDYAAKYAGDKGTVYRVEIPTSKLRGQESPDNGVKNYVIYPEVHYDPLDVTSYKVGE